MRPFSKKSLYILASVIFAVIFGSVALFLPKVFASSEEPEDDSEIVDISDFHHITIFDGGSRLSVKTDADTVAEVLDRAGISLLESDTVEPSLSSEITADNFFINIYRSHPALVIDNGQKLYLMTSSFEPVSIAREAGLEVYDGDSVSPVYNSDFLEYGAVSAYEIKRGGGETLTLEEEISFSSIEQKDFTLDFGKSEVLALGSPGQRRSVYRVQRIDGVEVSRTLVETMIVREPIDRVVRVGARLAAASSPSENESYTWRFLRSEGFSEVQTAGIMGNLMQEHGFQTSDSSGGLGIAQWTGGRRQNLLSHSDPYSISTQLSYLMEELNGGYAGVKAAILAATTIEDATRIFQNRFERCGICREDARISFAYSIYERYKQ